MRRKTELSFIPQHVIYIRLVCLLLTLSACFPVVLFLLSVSSKLGQRSLRWGYQLLLFSLNIRVQVRGQPVAGKALFVSNHISYADIPVLGALLSARFIAKSGVRTWPLIGWLAHRLGTFFVSREPRHTKKEIEMLQRAALQNNLILFPEGTSTEGTSVLPFKSTFFEILNTPSSEDQVIQPVSLVYKNLYGGPIGRFFRKFIGWRGDLEFVSHLCQMIALGDCTVWVTFHAPFSMKAGFSRKEMAQRAYHHVREGVRASLKGEIIEF